MAKRMVQVDAAVLEALQEKVKAMEQLLTGMAGQIEQKAKIKECSVCKCKETAFSDELAFKNHELECLLDEYNPYPDNSQKRQIKQSTCSKPKPLCPSCKTGLLILGKQSSHHIPLSQDVTCIVCTKPINIELEFGHCLNEKVSGGLFVHSECWLIVKK
jgi:hypothetical protein